MPDIPDSEILEFNNFDCSSRLAKWDPPNVFAYDPLSPKGDFLHFHPATIFAAEKTAKLLRAFFESAGELLPIQYDGEQYSLVNVTTCVDVLDDEKTEWFMADDGSKVSIRQIHRRRSTARVRQIG